jgi:glycosyltransferase involved in cell wall biosynthesis
MNYLCPIEPLFKAVASMIKNYPPGANKIEIIHVGHYDRKMMHELIQRYGLRPTVTLKGYLPKADAIRALASADMLYLAVADFGEYHILPGRVFDYLLSGKPILGIVPRGSDAETLLDEYAKNRVVSADNVSAAVEYIREVYDAKPAGKIENAMDAEIASKYTAPNVARQYAKLLDEVIG